MIWRLTVEGWMFHLSSYGYGWNVSPSPDVLPSLLFLRLYYKPYVFVSY